jgi:hypothetical protein
VCKVPKFHLWWSFPSTILLNNSKSKEGNMEGPLAQLLPELMALLMSFMGGRELAQFSGISQAFHSMANEVAKDRTIAAMGEGFKVHQGETWFNTLRFAEIQAGYGGSVVALGGVCLVMAAKTRGLIAAGTLFYEDEEDEEFSMPDNKLAERHHIVQVAVSNHIAAVTQSGKLLAAGLGDSGQLGLGNSHNEFYDMVEVGGALSELRVVSVAVGTYHTAVVTDNGWLFTFGEGGFSRLGHGTHAGELMPRRVLGALSGLRVVQVSASIYHTVAVTADGELYTFGCGESGRLGHGSDVDELAPRRVEGPLTGERVVAAAAGETHTVVLTASGAVFTFGYGGYGQLGHGNQQTQLSPMRVEALVNHRVVCIAAGAFHTVVLTDKGVVLTFGRLGDRELAVPAGKQAVDIVASEYRTGVVTSSGRLLMFGDEADWLEFALLDLPE